jgi:hypothetical protein
VFKIDTLRERIITDGHAPGHYRTDIVRNLGLQRSRIP